MSRSSNKRYRSYRDKKTQTKRFRRYFVRIFVLIISYSIFTMFVAVTLKVDTTSMEPNINNNSVLIFHPTQNLNSILHRNTGKSLKRGDVVITGTNYEVETSFFQNLVDPIVRIFTLQKKSIVYDNISYKGRAELLRVVGLPGDTIKMKDSTVYVKPSGQEFFLSEFELTEIDYDIIKKDYAASWKSEYPFSTELLEQFIDEDQYFLISDNRAIINDSRVMGFFPSSSIKGQILLKYWPFDEFALF